MTTLSLSLPQTGSPDASEEPKIPSDFTAIQNWANGNIDTDNLTAATSQAAGINTAGTKVKGTVFNAGPGTRTNTAYGALGDAADQVTGITLATNGLLRVWFQAQWQESALNAARAAIFVGANQLKVQSSVGGGVPAAVTEAAALNAIATVNDNAPLVSCPIGLVSAPTSGSGADVATGQAVATVGNVNPTVELGGTNVSSYYDPSSNSNINNIPFGGPCDIFAAAGTYTLAVMYKSSSGTVTASNRHLWVQAISFG